MRTCARGVALVVALSVVAVVWGPSPLVWMAAVPRNNPEAFLERADALRPVVLHDEAALAAYVATFPQADYALHRPSFLGVFYLDQEGPHDLVKATLAAREPWEPEIRAVLESFIVPGTAVIDAGAHIGTHTLAMARVAGRDGHVFAFEPQKKLYRELVWNLRANRIGNVTPLRIAVGDGPARIVEMDRDPGNEGGASIGEGGDAVELRTIDSFGFRRVSLIKIDVEGFERYVLDGAVRTIAADHPVLVVEIRGGSDYDTADDDTRAAIEATTARMRTLGYVVSRITEHDYLGVPVSSARTPLR